MLRRTTAARRAGFSLIELLIVIVIISILAGLLLAGVQAARRASRRATTANEINQLSIACTNFKNEFKMYPPCALTIPTTADPGNTNYVILRRMFPRMVIVDGSGNPVAEPLPSTTPIKFKDATTGLGVDIPDGGKVLDANQALVYFLSGPAGTGWHPTQPTAPTGTSKKGPFFEFQAARLKVFTDIWPTQSKPWYVDVYGSPYAYFASQQYSASGLKFPLDPTDGPIGGKWKSATDGSPAGTSLTPFFFAANKPVNPDSVQIVSAGADTRFGSGGTPWTAGDGNYAPGNDGGDDLANFNNGAVLGASPGK